MPFPFSDLYSLVPELILTFGAMVVLLIGLVARRMQVVSAISLLFVALAALTLAGPTTLAAFGGMYLFDSYGIFFKMIFLISAAAAILLSGRFLESRGEYQAEYYVVILFATVGMMFMASAMDLMVAYLGLELMALSTYVLAGSLRREPRSNEAAFKYFLNGSFASAFLLFGIALTYGMTGTTLLPSVAAAIRDAEIASNPALITGIAMIVAAFAFKIAMVPFHFWAPDAYEGAPTPITAFMSVGPKAAAFAVTARVLFGAYPDSAEAWGGMLAALAVITMIVGNLVALQQTNVKRMLAYSSIAHAGYMMLGIVAGTPESVGATMTYLMIYAFMNVGAFGVIVLLDDGQRAESLDAYKGLAKTNPGTALLLLLFMFSLTGIPPTAGFVGKFNLFQEVLRQGHTGLVLVAVLMSSVSAYYYLRVVMYMYMKDAEEESLVPKPTTGVGAALIAAVAGVVFLGLFPEALMTLARASLPVF